MIVAINQQTQYGKTGTTGVNLLPELSDDGSVVYAHSMDEAIKWLKSLPLYRDVEAESLGDGRLRLVSRWMEVEGGVLSFLYGPYDQATHRREESVIYTVNTVFVSAGYRHLEAR